MRRRIFENVFQDYEFLDRKEELFDFLYSIGMDSNSDTSYADINKDGENDTLMVHFNMGSVTVYVGLCNFSNGEFKYLLYIKSSEGIVLKPTFFDSVEEIENNVSTYIETAYGDTKLSYLGIENEKEYMPSKSEYNDMLNSAIDSQDWEEVRRIQNKYGKLYEIIKKIIRLTESDLTRIVKQVINENFKEISWEDIWFKLRRLSESFHYPNDPVYSFGGLDFMASKQGESLDLMDIYKDPYMWRNEYYKGVEVLEKYSVRLKNFVDEFNLKYDYPFTLMFKMGSNYDMKFYTQD